MSIRNLDAIFRPRSVALIGASDRPCSAGLVTLQNLLAGGFQGPIAPVNPKHKIIAGRPVYPDVQSLPFTPDLAVICTPPRTVPQLISDLAARGTKGAVVITAGFGELGSDEGHRLQQAILAAAQPHLLRIIGPNCLGVLSTPAGLNASFAPGSAKKGGIALIAQSGAMLTTVLDWANARSIGFSYLASLGDMADVDFGDMLDYLATDPATSAILLYIEAVTHPRKFISAARAAARMKPVIAIKAGRHQAAAKAATSHTGALAGSDAVYAAVFRRTGILRVQDLDELFDAVETLARARNFSGDDLVILTNGGGPGVLATDALLDCGGRLTDLSAQTIAKLDAALPPTWSHGNPVDIIGDAPPARYCDALGILLAASETNAVLVINCPTAIASSADAAIAVTRVASSATQPVLTNWLGTQSAVTARAAFDQAGLPNYDTPTAAIRGFMHLVRYHKGQRAILETTPSLATEFTSDESSARQIVARALTAGESWLNAADVGAVLRCYGIAVPRAGVAANPEEAARLAETYGAPVALKIYSPDITHKSDVGGVALDLKDADAVRNAAEAMLRRVAAAAPAARLQGFFVQEMIRRPGAYELIAGMSVDRQFGPVLLFGHGGTAAEIIADRALALPPLNLTLAQDLMGQTRIFRQLQGYRDRPRAALEDIALTLVKLSQLVCDLENIVELDLNPLLADAHGVIAVDARIRIAQSEADSVGRLAIRPYPKELECRVSLGTLGAIRLRPIKPEDAAMLARFAGDLSPEEMRMRFLTPAKGLGDAALARFTQIDYDREMAFVAHSEDDPGRLLGVVRLAADPDNVQAEFAIAVRSDLHRRGLGRLLLNCLVGYAQKRGISRLFGDVLAENLPMLGLCGKLGFAVAPTPSPGVLRATWIRAPQAV
ncbi:MAG TPA: bifunctional acetate--CoA ligase family protein/GNAT family N-acetyltransferase [Micropepsaceae bacterium]|jgi:acetyltransferase|nr:bifunctional acetate--CoA ligase family protein/GNAT family N-acetyltransferase [Micropepsaceae bacterium]